MESVHCSLVLILIIVNGIHSQDTMSDMIQTLKNKQEHDMNEIKDTMSDMTKSIKDIQQNIKDLKEIVEANNTKLNKQKDDILQIKDTVKDISQSMKNMSDILDIICKKPGDLCIRTKRYVLSIDEATFLQSFQNCQDQNRTLASIDSEKEYNIVNAYLKSFSEGGWFWTSGSRKDASSEFYWKSSGKSLSYTKWFPGDPNGVTDRNCILITTYNNNVVMSNYDCTADRKYLCEYIE